MTENLWGMKRNNKFIQDIGYSDFFFFLTHMAEYIMFLTFIFTYKSIHLVCVWINGLCQSCFETNLSNLAMMKVLILKDAVVTIESSVRILFNL